MNEAETHLREEFETIQAESVRRRLNTLLAMALEAARNAAHDAALEWASKECELGAAREQSNMYAHGVMICTNLAAHLRSGRKTP